MARHEADVVIIGGGITAAQVAQRLAELKPGIRIIVVEAGKRLFDFEKRTEYRERSLEYGENQWPGDFVADQSARGIISRTMAVGGKDHSQSQVVFVLVGRAAKDGSVRRRIAVVSSEQI